MTNYIDGFVLPVPRSQIESYKKVVEQVAEIWIEHGALRYSEFMGDDMSLEGTKSFIKATDANEEEEVIIFGWVEFESREARDLANKKVASDPRMTHLVLPLTQTSTPVFDAERMVYGGFKSVVQSLIKTYK